MRDNIVLELGVRAFLILALVVIIATGFYFL
jgi:hypothetical protein